MCKVEEIVEVIRKQLSDDYEVEVEKVWKNNIEKTAVTVKRIGDKVAPTIYRSAVA